MCDEFVRGGLPAHDCWLVDVVTTGEIGRAYINIVVRHRSGHPSMVKASTRDHEQAEALRQQVIADLAMMACCEFEKKYGLALQGAAA